jgi:hypothetical protein
MSNSSEINYYEKCAPCWSFSCKCIYIFWAIPRKSAIISLNSSNRLVFLMGSHCVFRETGIIQISSALQILKYIHDINVDYIKKINFPSTLARLASHIPAERNTNLKKNKVCTRKSWH